MWLRHVNVLICTRIDTREYLGKEVKLWLYQGENIILYIDDNDIFIKGPLRI